MKTTLAAFLFLFLGSSVIAGNSVEPGAFLIEPPTLHCLGFEWSISSDDNRNATVTVEYRKPTSPQWKKALPLLRIGGETVWFKRPKKSYVTPHMFAGSIFDLEPGTNYEVRFVMKDPDGGGGEKTITTKTKRLLERYEGGRKLHVYPAGFKGKKDDNAFGSLQKAFDGTKPGDQILIHAGTYVGHYVFQHNGTAEKPIAIRSAGDGEVILVGDKHRNMFDIHKADYLMFADLTFRDPGTGDGGHTIDGVVFWAGNRGHGATPGCKGLVVRRCKFEDFGVGVMGADNDCRDFTITDNYFIGRQSWLQNCHDMDFKDYQKWSWTAVWISGAGHDIGYNYVKGFRDGLNISSGSAYKGETSQFRPDRKNVSIDFYNNEIMECGDDFIETDGGANNIRVYRNRCTNSATCGLSAQPVYGGPVYLIRNTIYNVGRHAPLKLNCEPAGVLLYHNTIIERPSSANWSNCHFRNNIILGIWRGFCLPMGTVTDYSSMDYNAYLPGRVYFRMPKLGWHNRDKWQLKANAFENLETFAKAVGYETHGVTVNYDIFEGAMIEGKGLGKTYEPASIKFSLRKGAAVIDAGEFLPNINDNHTGKGPDLGAFETGTKPPHYGPRKKDK